MDIRELDPGDEAQVHRHWEIGKAAEDASRPYDFYVPWELAWLTYSQGREDLKMVLLGAYEHDEMWGAARVDHTVHDNLHSATAECHVHPDQQRRGIGRALAEAAEGVARDNGRRVLMTEAYAPPAGSSAGLQFALAMGFVQALEEGMKVVDLLGTEPLWEGLAAKCAPRHVGYTIVTWLDRVPAEYVEDYCRLNEEFFDERLPMGSLDVEAERWDADRVHEREQRNARTGRHQVSAGAVAPDGRMIALTEVMVSEQALWRGFQSGTLVSPAHRGLGLGLATKVANHRQLRATYPDCRVLLTGNADVNAPMNAVNEALGYREVERCVEMQKNI